MYRTPKVDNWAPGTINNETALQDFNYNYLCTITDRTEIVFVGKSLHISSYHETTRKRTVPLIVLAST